MVETPEPAAVAVLLAEVMAEEPLKSKGRRWKPQQAAASLFGLALSLDQEWETKLVGAGPKSESEERGLASYKGKVNTGG